MPDIFSSDVVIVNTETGESIDVTNQADVVGEAPGASLGGGQPVPTESGGVGEMGSDGNSVISQGVAKDTSGVQGTSDTVQTVSGRVYSCPMTV